MYLNLDLLYNVDNYMFQIEWYNWNLLYCEYSNKGIVLYINNHIPARLFDFGHFKELCTFKGKLYLNVKDGLEFFENHELILDMKKHITEKNKGMILDSRIMEFLKSKKDNIMDFENSFKI